MRIGLDLMGGDAAPLKVLQGALMFLSDNFDDTELVLIGKLESVQKQYPGLVSAIKEFPNTTFIDASEVIQMGDMPTKAFNQKKNSSIVVGFKMLASNDLDAFASAGNTGAMMVGAYYFAKPITGVIRPAIATIIPKINKKIGIMLDIGVNPDCRQDVLAQFGLLGSSYIETIFNIKNPKVGLLNIGSEPEKGNLVSQAAYQLMINESRINFIGNIEGYDILSEKADVIVCDGFTGNIVLKTIEGFYKSIKQRGIDDEFFNSMNYENYGGTPILGINKPVIVAHGMSSDIAINNMLKQTHAVVKNKLINILINYFNSIKSE